MVLKFARPGDADNRRTHTPSPKVETKEGAGRGARTVLDGWPNNKSGVQNLPIIMRLVGGEEAVPKGTNKPGVCITWTGQVINQTTHQDYGEVSQPAFSCPTKTRKRGSLLCRAVGGGITPSQAPFDLGTSATSPSASSWSCSSTNTVTAGEGGASATGT